MSVTMDFRIKGWTAKRKKALVVEIIHGTTAVAETSRAIDLSPSEVVGWVDDEPVTYLCRRDCSFMPLGVQRQRGFCLPMLNVDGAGYTSR